MRRDIIKQFLPTIKNHFPDVEADEIKVFDNGHDHYVFVVDGVHAFRFPRSNNHGKHDDIVNEFSQKFAPLSPIPIQNMTGHVDPNTGIRYQTYEFINGIPLTKELAQSLPEDILQLVAKDMGRFLSALHSFSVSEAKKMGMESLISPQDYAEYFVSVIDLDKKFIFDLLTKDEWNWFVENVKIFKKVSCEHPYSFTVTHSDMLPEHILINEKTQRLSGILDFTLRIADPANDFKYFDRYGETFLKTVYENYLPVDEYFDKRRQFYAADLPVANLYQSVERGDLGDEQQRFLSELISYIANKKN